MIDICIITLNRADRLEKMLRSIDATALNPAEVGVCLRTHIEDTATRDMLAGLELGLRYIRVLEGVAPDTISIGWNEAQALGDGDIALLIGDDCVFETYGWDTRVEEVFDRYDDRLVLVWTADGINDGTTQGGHPFVSRKGIELLGYFVPGIFPMLYTDTWLMEIYGKARRTVYVGDVMIRHLHFSKHPELMDSTYEDCRKRGDGKKAREIWAATRQTRNEDFHKLMAAIKEGRNA